MKKCRACFKVNHALEIESALDKLRKMKYLKICEQKEYEERLVICKACEYADKNGVCMSCGCYVQIRAFVQTNKCPLGRLRKW